MIKRIQSNWMPHCHNFFEPEFDILPLKVYQISDEPRRLSIWSIPWPFMGSVIRDIIQPLLSGNIISRQISWLPMAQHQTTASSNVGISSTGSCNIHLGAISWWRHQMETFSTLLAHCAGNSPVTGEFPSQRPVTRNFQFSLICTWINDWVNNREAGDLRRHRIHYDGAVMFTGRGICSTQFSHRVIINGPWKTRLWY